MFLVGSLGTCGVDPLDVLGERAGSARRAEQGRGATHEAVDSLEGGASGGCRTALNHEVLHPRVMGTLNKSAAGLSRVAGQGNETDFCIVQRSPVPGRQFIVRRPTPVEAERLMGFPDGWTDVQFKGRRALDIHRYGALGNSIVTDCLAYIGGKLLAAHFDTEAHEEYVYGLAA